MCRRAVWYRSTFLAGYLRGLILDPENGGSMFLRTTSELLPGYTEYSSYYGIYAQARTVKPEKQPLLGNGCHTQQLGYCWKPILSSERMLRKTMTARAKVHFSLCLTN
jgi:hypothetical protein